MTSDDKKRIEEIRESLNLQRLVDAFLAWPLPNSVCSDLCVTERDDRGRGRIGTNLLTADEAKQMLIYLLKDARKALGEE